MTSRHISQNNQIMLKTNYLCRIVAVSTEVLFGIITHKHAKGKLKWHIMTFIELFLKLLEVSVCHVSMLQRELIALMF